MKEEAVYGHVGFLLSCLVSSCVTQTFDQAFFKVRLGYDFCGFRKYFFVSMHVLMVSSFPNSFSYS